MTIYHCYKCGYKWEIRTEKPKSCPRCKTRLDIVIKEKINHQKEVKLSIIDETKKENDTLPYKEESKNGTNKIQA